MKQVTAAAAFLLRMIKPTRGRHRPRRQPAAYRASLLDELLGGDE
jgi:hypothetical protein